MLIFPAANCLKAFMYPCPSGLLNIAPVTPRRIDFVIISGTPVAIVATSTALCTEDWNPVNSSTPGGSGYTGAENVVLPASISLLLQTFPFSSWYIAKSFCTPADLL